MSDTQSTESTGGRRWRWLLSWPFLAVYCIGFAFWGFYLTQWPGKLVPSQMTTGMENPVLYDGHPDYSAAIEGLFDDLAEPPSENGFREFLIACGPPILGETEMMTRAEWAAIPKAEKFYFYEQTWLPLCEKLEIDPHAIPVYLESRCFTDSASRFGGGEDFKVNEYMRELTSRPFSSEDHPEVAKWLEERKPVLDLFGECVRKTKFQYQVVLPRRLSPVFIMSNERHCLSIANDLLVRISNRVEQGKIEAAWYDVMSLLHVSRFHLAKSPSMIAILIRRSLEMTAFKGAKLILENGNVDETLLQEFAADLADLPSPYLAASRVKLDRLERHKRLYAISQKEPFTMGPITDRVLAIKITGKTTFPELAIQAVEGGIDPNIAGAELSRLYDEVGLGFEGLKKFDELDPEAKRILLEKFIAKSRESGNYIENELTSSSQIWTIQSRSRIVALAILADELYVENSILFPDFEVFEEIETRKGLAETAVAIERFRLGDGRYPGDLEELCPEYLTVVPSDPFGTCDEMLIYRAPAEEEKPYLLYSLGRDKTDEGGDSEENRDLVW